MLQPLLPFPVTLKEPSPADTFRMTLDETPYFAPDAVPFCLEQPVTMPGERTFNQRKLAENNPLKRLQPGFDSSQTFTLLFKQPWVVRWTKWRTGSATGMIFTRCLSP